MEYNEISGYYTYRSFLDNPLPVEDFNRIKFFEAEIFLYVQLDGTITGTLSFPAKEGASQKEFMNITGTVKNHLSSIVLNFVGRGRPNTPIFDYLYEYYCSVTHTWEKGIGQRLELTGTVLRVQDHGSGEDTYKAGQTASFVSVNRDFVEPRNIEGVALIPSALKMLASKSHRLRHGVWHTLRERGLWQNILNDKERKSIADLGWGLDRPPFTKEGILDLTNGAGEDFLFMHRKMIAMVRKVYDSQGDPYIESWKNLPFPSTPQFFYSEQDDPENPGKKIYRFNPKESGYMVPPAYLLSDEEGELDTNTNNFIKFLKTPNYFTSVMRYLESQFKNRTFLNSLSLGTLGNLLEFVIHNQMHLRWSSTPKDPKTGKQPVDPRTGNPTARSPFDFDDKWDDPKYDWLGEFYSSHVNPVFWKLHGWVDDRIEDWYNAHDASHPGEIERYEFKEIQWFKPGKWVQVSNPLYWPEQIGHNHGHHNNNHSNNHDELENMLKVMEILRIALSRPPSNEDTLKFLTVQNPLLMTFIMSIFPAK